MTTGTLLVLAIVALMSFGHHRRVPHPRHRLEQDRARYRTELDEVRRMVDDLSARFHRLETERDFYRDLAAPEGARTWRGPALFPASAGPSKRAQDGRSTEPSSAP